MKYKGFSIEIVDWTIEKYYQIFNELGFFKGEAKTIKEAKDFINDYLK